MSRAKTRKGKSNRSTIIIAVLAVFVIALAFILIKSAVEVSHSQSQSPKPVTETDVTVIEEQAEPEKKAAEVSLNVDFTKADDVTSAALTDFFRQYYEYVSGLSEETFDVSAHFRNAEGISALRYKTAVEYLSEVRRMQNVDLSMLSVRADLKATKYSDDGEKIKVTVMEDTFMRFSEFKDIETEIYGIENNFTFDKATGRLISYKKVQDFYILFQEAENQSELDSLKGKYTELITKNAAKRDKDKETILTGAVEANTADHEYDRQKAGEYAKTYVNSRNKAYMSLDGNNCQNFVSQVLRAGGIPDDHSSTGDYTTWYYNSASDFTTVWTYVPYFREYVKSNTGPGLAAKVDANWYTAEPGDIVEVGITGPTRHTTVVADVYYDESGNYVDALLSSNTLDMRNFPVTAYVYPYTSLIKVYGWNE